MEVNINEFKFNSNIIKNLAKFKEIELICKLIIIYIKFIILIKI